MNPEQIRARQLIIDLETQAKELKEEITQEMKAAITQALRQSYTLGQEDLKEQAIEKLREEVGIRNKYPTNLSENKRIELGNVLKIFDIVVTKSGKETILKTTEQ